MNVFCDTGGSGFPIFVSPAAKTLTVGKTVAPFALNDGEALKLRVFLDKGMVEVFANDRQAVVAAHAHDPAQVGIGVFSRDGVAVVEEVRGWKMKSIYSR